MFDVLKSAHVFSFVLIAALSAPAAIAGELPPAAGLASPASSNRFIENRTRGNGISTPDSPGQRYADSRANARDGGTASVRGNRLINYGRQAMRDGDNGGACSYFRQAREAFAEDHISHGMARSEDLMAKTCQA